MRCAPVVYITLLLVVLAAVLLTYPKLPPAPDPALARFTNYPAWHSTLKEWDQQQIDMTGAFTIMLVFLCTFYSFKWTMYDNVASKNTAAYIYDGTQLNSALPFDRLLAWYTLATHISGWAYVLLDIGKLWGAFGLLHNTGEVVILLLLHDGGRIRRNRYFYLVGGYMSIVFLGIVYLDWPKDAIFFKTQGQCIDWSLLIAFVRVALETRRRVREGRVVLPQNANDVVPDDIVPDDVVPDDVVPDDVVPDEDDAPSTDSTINNVDHPKQLWILVAAAFVHIVGNVAATIGPDTGKYFLIFMHSYYISFPLYAYYIFLDTHSRAAVPKHIYVYRDPAWKTAALVIVSIILSLLTMRLAFMGLS